MPKTNSNAQWNGNLKQGNGSITFSDYKGNYSFDTRFEDDESGTNPEQLLGAAFAGCFTMAFSHGLDQAGYTANSVNTEATVKVEKNEDGLTVTQITLKTSGNVPGITDDEFQKLAGEAKQNCPIGKALSAVPEINLETELKKQAA